MQEKNNAEETDKKLLKIINYYGVKSQEDVLIEEMAELTQAIMKLRRKSGFKDFENIFEEIADVRIMLRQLELILKLTDPQTDDFISEDIEYKINRQLQRMEGGKSE